jgi:hypothetical protein
VASFQCYSGSLWRTISWPVAAGGLPVEKRGLFLEQVAARLMLRDRFNDADLDDAVRVALRRLIESAA